MISGVYMSNKRQKLPSRLVLILAFDGVQIIDIAEPAQVLSTANEEGADPHYDVRIVALKAGLIESESGFAILAGEIPKEGAVDTLVVPGGPGVHILRKNPLVNIALNDLSQRAARVCSVCTGSFLLAEAGILDGRRAVTHWRSTDRLAREFPNVKVDPDPIFLNDGPVWTTAGVTAGIDLTLSLVQQDHGAALSARVARRLVDYMRRAGGQKQYSEPLALQAASGAPFDALSCQIAGDPRLQWTVEKMAETAGQSLRTFHRRFEAATGQSPAKAVEKIRCDLARSLLHTTDMSLGQIADRTGLGSETPLRRAMTRQFCVNPGEMLDRFA
ncbi:AraC family transcriptional regulator [Bradyrhizobium sp. LTSP849]|uniref:GlxA family transcriptional regulator n=2 Tax=unclassified Bradyrhizobium TaxID=2631580 RepID=UPI000B29232C|nr:AraC family transcriptional regulator [Bradyrhizobium sp. LTSP849]